jgi:hypothetical protein
MHEENVMSSTYAETLDAHPRLWRFCRAQRDLGAQWRAANPFPRLTLPGLGEWGALIDPYVAACASHFLLFLAGVLLAGISGWLRSRGASPAPARPGYQRRPRAVRRSSAWYPRPPYRATKARVRSSAGRRAGRPRRLRRAQPRVLYDAISARYLFWPGGGARAAD